MQNLNRFMYNEGFIPDNLFLLPLQRRALEIHSFFHVFKMQKPRVQPPSVLSCSCAMLMLMFGYIVYTRQEGRDCYALQIEPGISCIGISSEISIQIYRYQSKVSHLFFL